MEGNLPTYKFSFRFDLLSRRENQVRDAIASQGDAFLSGRLQFFPKRGLFNAEDQAARKRDG